MSLARTSTPVKSVAQHFREVLLLRCYNIKLPSNHLHDEHVIDTPQEREPELCTYIISAKTALNGQVCGALRCP